jgi:rhodanese-related sulfurtransferase
MISFIILAISSFAIASALYAHGNHDSFSSISAKNDTQLGKTHGYREIQIDDLSELVRISNPSVKIVDARSAQYDDGKRIPGALVIPANATTEYIATHLPNKEARIIVYCSNPECRASGMLAERLVQMGYKKVWKYPGGIKEWVESGQKVEKGKPALKAASE